MDPLSVATGIVTVIQLSAEVARFLRAVDGATRERKDLLNEVRACGNILQELSDQADDSEEGREWSETIRALEAPNAPLGRLSITLTTVAFKLQPKAGLQKAVESLKWPFKQKEVDRVLTAIEREKSLLALALENNARKLIQEIRKTSSENTQQLALVIKILEEETGEINARFSELLDGVDRIELSQADLKDGLTRLHNQQDNRDVNEDRLKILNWITPIDYAPQQSDFIGRRQPGTGQWLLDSEEFGTWVEAERKTLFCPGIPGAGKTILTAIVAEELATRFGDNEDVGIAYIYCNFRRQDEQKAEDLLANLLKQLVEGRNSLPHSVKLLYDNHKALKTRPPIREVSNTLQSVAALYSRVFVIIDALDECQISDSCREDFLSHIFDIQNQTRANIFATSRPLLDIREKFKGCLTREIIASNEDVCRYIDGQMQKLPRFVSKKPDLQAQIISEISSAVDGMFLLAQLYTDSLKDKTSVTEMKAALRDLQRNSQEQMSREGGRQTALSKAYEHAMERIDGQMRGFRELAKRVLPWITRANRPLTTSELQHALAVKIGDAQLDEDNIREIEDIVSVCAGLVTVDEESGIIRLVHYTTQEYLDHTYGRWFSITEEDITITCLTYLSFNNFATGHCQTDEEFEGRLRENPLYNYAAGNWGHHARKVSSVCQGVTEFLECKPKVQAAAQALMVAERNDEDSGYSQRVPSQMSGLHLAAYFGIETAARLLLEHNNPEAKDSWGQTPLTFAAENGHKAITQLLLSKGADIEVKCKNGRTPLSHAAEGGHEAVVQLLLNEGADIETKDGENRRPLSYAVESDRNAVIRLLLDKGADIESKGKDGWTPLISAVIKNEDGSCIELLLSMGADIEGRDGIGWTALNHAAVTRQPAAVQLLLKNGADIETKNDFGWTPLICAALMEDVLVLEMLLDYGADIESRTGDAHTPLMYAVEKGYEPGVRFLVSRGANIEAEDGRGITPLAHADYCGFPAIVEYLQEQISKKVDVEANDASG